MSRKRYKSEQIINLLREAEVDWCDRSKMHKPHEFGVKVSVATTNTRSRGGQFVLHTKALPGLPYDGHALVTVITETQALTGIEVERVYID